MSKKLALLLCAAASMVSCAIPAAADEAVKEHIDVPAPPEGKAQVVFFRPGGFGGSAISCAVSENGTKVSSLPPARFFILVAEPGKHVYTAASEAKDEVYYNLKSGQTVYVKCSIAMGFMVGRPKLEAAEELEFSTKTWKSVSTDRMSENVLTDEQIAAALAAQSAPQAVVQPAPAQPVDDVPAVVAVPVAAAATSSAQ